MDSAAQIDKEESKIFSEIFLSLSKNHQEFLLDNSGGKEANLWIQGVGK
jgi:hypothetical protein